ncbi:YfhE family protein [Metabacillus sp. BG109]|uniref:YfhE family protein n=1 Tax=Metabacillus bambusae TaxID=2795218 RepID=A0ABS3NC70_9BACI|nr:YfhE family protein [Metabacillus bambusae]
MITLASEKKKRDKTKSTLSSMQEVTYSREFKSADRAGGYISKSRH